MTEVREDYMVLSKHAEQLACGVMVAPEKKFSADLLDLENPHDKLLLDEGKIYQIEPDVLPVVPDPSEEAVLLAEEYGVDLSTIKGSGSKDRIVKGDVERIISDNDLQPISPTPDKVVPGTTDNDKGGEG